MLLLGICFWQSLFLLVVLSPVCANAGNDESEGKVMENDDEIRALLDRAVEEGKLPVSVALVASSEDILFAHASGFRDADRRQPMMSDSIFAIASMTKLITTIAVLQLAESEQVDLDSGLDRYLPETAKPKILRGFDQGDNPILIDASRAPTIRELMTHTSGYVYSIWNETALSAQAKGVTSPLGGGKESIVAPLYFEPGSKWEYGVGIDWLGVLVEEVSGKRLMDFFLENIFMPLQMEDTFFELPPEKMDRSVMMSARVKGRLVKSELYQPVAAEKGSMTFYGGGGGLYSTVSDYARVMRALLGGGSLDGQRVLSEGMVDQMFQNQIGSIDVSGGSAQIKTLSNDFDMGFGSSAKWGLGFLLSPEGTENGRASGSGSWGGLFNSYFWIDRENDLCAVFATQVLPFFDEESVAVLKAYERAVYGS